MSPAELIAHDEHEQEWGGYFVVKGLERILRMLIATRRNYPIAMKKHAWKSRGEHFSDLGIFLRSVRDDNTTVVCISYLFYDE
jgi:DNA-directed RNA polymerase I subunit RPA2